MKKAFTLIEILISMLIIGIIMGIGSLSYRDYTRRQQVTAAARQIRADLVDAQQQALSGNKLGCTGVLDTYTVSRISVTQYQIAGICSGPPTTNVYKLATLPTNTQMDNFSNISFKTVGEGTVIVGNSITITLRAMSGSTFTEAVVVDRSGGIR